MNRITLDIGKHTGLAADYLTNATDRQNDDLPYWYLALSEDPAYARHCRVDDAELVGSWGEALLCAGQVLGGLTDEQARILENWDRILLRGFRDNGLRYNLDYPWAQRSILVLTPDRQVLEVPAQQPDPLGIGPHVEPGHRTGPNPRSKQFDTDARPERILHGPFAIQHVRYSGVKVPDLPVGRVGPIRKGFIRRVGRLRVQV